MYDYTDNPSNADLLQQAATLASDGKPREARSLVKQAIRNDRHDAVAWWALTQLASSDAERRHALDEVLALEPENPHALHMRDQLAAGTLSHIDQTGSSRPNVKPYATFNAKIGYVEPKDYLVPALVTLVLYWLFWIAGLGFNIYYLRDARKLEAATGEKQKNVGCLKALMGFYVALPLIAVAVIVVLALVENSMPPPR